MILNYFKTVFIHLYANIACKDIHVFIDSAVYYMRLSDIAGTKAVWPETGVQDTAPACIYNFMVI